MLKRVLFSMIAWLAFVTLAAAATLLPLAETTFLDNNGAPLSGGQVYFYVPNTLTPKSTFQNSAGTVANSNPVTLDGSGRAIIYGAGQYRQQVYDANGNLIWDQLTADTSAVGSYSWAGISAGTANAQTVSAPNFTQVDGQQIGFIAGFSNTAALTVNGITVVKASATGPQSLSAGDVIAGNQYFLSYSANNGDFQINTLPAQAILPQTPIASASTTDLGTIGSHNALITGNVNINSFGASASITSQFYYISFASSVFITSSSAILTPNGGNIQALQGDSAFLAYLGGGVWQIVSYSPASANAIAPPPGGRLSLASGNPVAIVVIGTASLVYTPYLGNQMPVWNGAAWQAATFAELAQVLSDSTHSPAAAVQGAVYDEFVWQFSPGIFVLSRGPAWTSTTSRALSLSMQNGVLVNSTGITNGPGAGFGVYVGTIATDAGAATVTMNPVPAAASSGPATPTAGAWVGVWNYYNRVTIGATARDSNATWNVSSTSWTQADGSGNNRISFVVGEVEDNIFASYSVMQTGGTHYGASGVGVDSSSVNFGSTQISTATGGAIAPVTSAWLGDVASAGFHFIQALEEVDNAAGTTFFGIAPGISANAQTMNLSAQLKF